MRNKAMKGNITGFQNGDPIVSLLIVGEEHDFVIPTTQFKYVEPNYGTPIWVDIKQDLSTVITKRRIHSRKSKKKLRTKARKEISVMQKFINELLD
ncbi:MAG: hypothetical protein GY760_24725 [Deltaproteobacteria bacterium]|nr:hypothetical protein [Deltaproteobacteria bacterium]